MQLYLIVLLPFLASIVSVLLPRDARNQEAWLAGGTGLVCALLTLWQLPDLLHGQIISQKIDWIPSLSLSFHLRMDGFVWLFALMVSGIGSLVVLYARYYMDPKDPVHRFFSFFLIFMGSMLGLVLSGNVIQMVMFWELTSLASFMLIAYWYHRADARRGARMALAITATGGFSLLASMLMMGDVVGSYELSDILKNAWRIQHSPLYIPIVITFAIGCLTKSAQFPFHFWLPNAMAAPTPVSAYLHSATLVKVGVFALCRFWPVLSGTDWWFWIISGSGMISLALGAYVAFFQKDMKGILAYSTISHLGLITSLIGMNSRLALVVAVFHIINHSTFKASLFMATGIVDHETGTRDVSVLSGLRRAMPITATLAIVAAMAMAGVPLLNGFISKEMFFSETLFITDNTSLENHLLFPVIAVLASIFSVAYSLRFILEVFFGQPHFDQLPRYPHEPPKWMIVPSAVLVLVCLLVGMVPQLIFPILQLSMQALLPHKVPSYSLALWHGFNIPLLMSFLALSGGVALTLIMRKSIRQYPNQTPLLGHLQGRFIFLKIMDVIDAFAYDVMYWFSSSRLQVQMYLIVVISFVVALLPLLGRYTVPLPHFDHIDIGFLLLWIVGATCAVCAAHQAHSNRFRALVLVGGTGITVATTFAWLSAPDLALTQIVVEVVTTILLLLGLRWLPRRLTHFSEEDELITSLRLRRDFITALVVGLGMAFITYVLMIRKTTSDTLGDFFIRHALPDGGGTNVVNVILVDFRGFDTFGEITVLCVVSLTVFALLRRFRPPQEMINALEKRNVAMTPDLRRLTEESSTLPRGTLLVPNVLVRFIMPVFSLIAVYFFLRGHNLPGGGFVGGLIFAIGIVAQFIVSGIEWVETRSRIRPQKWIATGLLLAVCSALWPLAVGKPFLSALVWDPHFPLIGHVHLSTVMLFDLGVFSLVVGCSTYILVALAHQSLRFYRKPGANK